MMDISPYIGEPVTGKDGQYQLIVIDKEMRRPKVIDFNDIEDYFDIKDVGSGLQSFIFQHYKDWKYPSELHLYERLADDEGRVHFRPLDENFTIRTTSVCDRILNYLSKYVRLPGQFDAVIVMAFIISTYFMELFEYAPRLLIRGATNSGKSTLLNILSELCYRGNLSGDTTEASLFRLIDSCHITPLLDEFQDYDTSAQNGIKKILKNGNVRGHCVQRAEKVGNGPSIPRSYDVFSPVAFVNQAGNKSLPEEVINRSMSLTMISRGDVLLPMKPDREELKEIRDELYSIRWSWLADPKLVGFERIYDEALGELQDPDGVATPFGNVHYSSRCRDILGTMYTVGKMTGMEEPILRYFDNMQKVAEDEDRNNDLGVVFAAIMGVLENNDYCELFVGNITDLLETVTTFDVARQYERILGDEGELQNNIRVPTRTVTNMLKDMGFQFVRDRNTNRSLFSHSDLEVVFQMNLFKYGTDEQRERYGDKLITKRSNKADDAVKEQCQIDRLPNNLTGEGE